MERQLHDPTTRRRIALIGAGSVGVAVAELLRRSGHAVVAVASRTDESTQRAAARLGAQPFSLDAGLPHDVDLVLLGLPDAAIEPVARRVSTHAPEGAIAVHFGGALGRAPLAPLADAGLHTAALHPVQACPDPDTAIARLPGSAWGVTAATDIQEWASATIRTDLGGVPVAVAEKDRALWHAAAVTTSNALAALLWAGESMLARIGIAAPEAVLAPLAAGTVENARAGGGGGATLTGPAVRGDATTLRRHVDALTDWAPELLDAYADAARLILTAARATDRIDATTAAAIEEVLAR